MKLFSAKPINEGPLSFAAKASEGSLEFNLELHFKFKVVMRGAAANKSHLYLPTKFWHTWHNLAATIGRVIRVLFFLLIRLIDIWNLGMSL